MEVRNSRSYSRSRCEVREAELILGLEGWIGLGVGDKINCFFKPLQNVPRLAVSGRIHLLVLSVTVHRLLQWVNSFG